MTFLFNIERLDINVTSLDWFERAKSPILLGLMGFNEFRRVHLVNFSVDSKYDFWSKSVTAVHFANQFVIPIEVLLSSIICPRREGNR
jgi:hypothetical protein